MSWKIDTKKSEKFLYKHLHLWPLNKFKQSKEYNKLKQSYKKNGTYKLDKIIIEDELFQPEVFNLNIIIHVGNLRKFKELYRKIGEKNEIKNLEFGTKKINYKDNSFYNSENYINLDMVIFNNDKYFKNMSCSILRISESFVHISFRFIITNLMINNFYQTLVEYKEHFFKFSNYSLKKFLTNKKTPISIYNNRDTTKNEIFNFLSDIRQHAIKTVGKGIINIHIGDKNSIFSCFIFSYLMKNKEAKIEDFSLFSQLKLDFNKDVFSKYSTNDNGISLIFSNTKYDFLDKNSQIIFFDRAAITQEDLIYHGGEYIYYISNYLRLYLEATIIQDFVINTILSSYYRLLTKYRFNKNRKYSFFAYRRYNNFFKETLFLKSFVNEYDSDIKLRELNYKKLLGEFYETRNIKIQFYKSINKIIQRHYLSIDALNKSISDIIISKRDDSIIKSNRRLQWIIIILTIISIYPFLRDFFQSL